MKQFALFGVAFLFITYSGYKKKTHLLPSDIKVVNYNASLKKNDNGWFFNGNLFSGYMIEQERDGQIVYQLPIIDGKENGMAKGWYNTGEKLLERLFEKGQKAGEFKQWWPNGNYRYIFHYKNDLMDGEQEVFFPNGDKRQVNNYVAGQEEGLQSTWDEEGILISNYTIRNKKLYGVIAVKSCIPVLH